MSKLKAVLNYTGQLRLYSFLDLFIFATALTTDWATIGGIALLWLSFLLYLESRHKDKPRLKINEMVWLGPFVAALFLVPIWVAVGFAVFSYLYTKKKESFVLGVSAPLWRALQNAIIAAAFNWRLALLAFVLTFIRNVIGDLRDVRDDKVRNIATIPVAMGMNRNQSWAFYGHLVFTIFTTLVWFNFSFLDKNLIIPTILIQVISYPLTPRLSNPKYLDIYQQEK